MSVAALILGILFLLSLSTALGKCSKASRTMEPGLVWLMLVPVFGVVWQFAVVIALARSLGNEFRARGISSLEAQPGRSIGIAMCVSALCGMVPLLNLVALPAAVVLLIIYWVKVSSFSRTLDQTPTANETALNAPSVVQSEVQPPRLGEPQTPYAPSSQLAGAWRSTPVFIWVLVGVIAFLSICVPILLLIAIPTIGSLKKRANDLPALQSMRIIKQAELQYSVTYPANGFACSLPALGGDPKSNAPTATSAQMIQGDLASGFKSGYIFTLTCNDKATVHGVDRFISYSITAVPQTVGKTGDRGFCSDQSGIIKFDPVGGANCDETVGP
jgi:type IV pilus assembly protein PilA